MRLSISRGGGGFTGKRGGLKFLKCKSPKKPSSTRREKNILNREKGEKGFLHEKKVFQYEEERELPPKQHGARGEKGTAGQRKGGSICAKEQSRSEREGT